MTDAEAKQLAEELWAEDGHPLAGAYLEQATTVGELARIVEQMTEKLAKVAAERDALLAKVAARVEGWRPIETAPKMRTILLFAVTDIADDGTVKNWKMATGSWHTGYEDARSKLEGLTPWEWAGHRLRVYELHPTHWMPLPPAPPSAPDPA